MNITLHNCTIETIQAILAGNEPLAKHLDVQVPENWSTFGLPAFRYTLRILESQSQHARWWTYLPILEDQDKRVIVGSCGYKGPPDELGMVEIGYEVAETYRNRGLASKMAALLVKQAFADPQVRSVQAHTLAEENASVKVLRKNGFQFMEEIEDEEDGKIWKWILLP